MLKNSILGKKCEKDDILLYFSEISILFYLKTEVLNWLLELKLDKLIFLLSIYKFIMLRIKTSLFSSRQSLSLHTIATTSTTPSIQITLQASRTGEIAGKPVTTFQPAKLHVNQGLNMTSQPKVVMSQPVTPVMHHQTLAAKANKGAPMSSSLSTVTVSLSTATVTIPIISGTTSSSAIPIGKFLLFR